LEESESMSSTKVALITGITGQDGAYLSDLLLQKGYTVHGIKRRSSISRIPRFDQLESVKSQIGKNLHLHDGDLTDSSNLTQIIAQTEPDEIYNLAAQSHVQVSFNTPEYTADVDAVGTLRLLEAVRILGLKEKTRFYQASTSELFGSSPPPQSETTPFQPCSPYAVAKLYAFWIVANYRDAYDFHASNGILFNHESPLRGEEFVTRKITRAVAAIKAGQQEKLFLGNLDAKRDWGHARDYVEGMWRMLQQPEPDDYVLATGVAHSVREFVQAAFEQVGVQIQWSGVGVEEFGVDRESGKTLVEVDPQFFRPSEVHHLLGDCSKANEKLGWEPATSFEQLVNEMVTADQKLF